MNTAALQVAATELATIVLAQPEGPDTGGRGAGFGKSTPLGLFLMIVLLIGVGLLVRSMTKHLKRVPRDFDPDAEQGESEQQSDAEDAEVTEDAEDAEDSAVAEQHGSGDDREKSPPD